jgi:hypothetical protein
MDLEDFYATLNKNNPHYVEEQWNICNSLIDANSEQVFPGQYDLQHRTHIIEQAINVLFGALSFGDEKAIDMLYKICNVSVFKEKYAERYNEELHRHRIKKILSCAKSINDYEELCMEIVDKNGMDIRYCESRSYDVCIAAVNQNGLALQFIRDKPKFIENTDWKYFEDFDAESAEKIKRQNKYEKYLLDKYCVGQIYEICYVAILQNWKAIQYVNEENLSDELCIHALMQNEEALKYIKKITPKIREFIDESRKKLRCDSYKLKLH